MIPLDDSHLREDNTMLLNYMDIVKEQAMQKLTNLEMAALLNDFEEFQIRYREEIEEANAQWEEV